MAEKSIHTKSQSPVCEVSKSFSQIFKRVRFCALTSHLRMNVCLINCLFLVSNHNVVLKCLTIAKPDEL
ncbi:hypothetical protein P8452_29088 [Trifolium repens]|nr:hypothetical protein P8452_29088 [Trifolium repens]